MTDSLLSTGRARLAGLVIMLTAACPTFGDAKISITGTIYAPIPCTISGAQSTLIQVDFGEVITSRIDGSYLTKKIPYVLDCRNAAKNALRMQITGLEANFGDRLLAVSSHPDLAISLKNGTTSIGVRQWIDFDLNKPPQLNAVLVKTKDADLQAGTFVVGATLVVEYQ